MYEFTIWRCKEHRRVYLHWSQEGGTERYKADACNCYWNSKSSTWCERARVIEYGS